MQIAKSTPAGIKKAAAILKRGGVIVYPTDTAYALGGVFNSAKVSRRILGIKKRIDNKFTVVASDLNQVKKYFKLSAAAEKLARRYWPSALSIVVSRRYAVRVPDLEIAQKLAKLAGKPLIATSANFCGQPTIYSGRKIIKQFGNIMDSSLKPDLIIDAGRLKKTKTSTVVLVNKKRIKIIRAGGIEIDL